MIPSGSSTSSSTSMIGRSTTPRPTRLSNAALALILTVFATAAGPSLAQSGRIRERAGRPVPTPQPTAPASPTATPPQPTPPNPTAPARAVAPGAKVTRQDTEGAVYRFVLRNE